QAPQAVPHLPEGDAQRVDRRGNRLWVGPAGEEPGWPEQLPVVRSDVPLARLPAVVPRGVLGWVRGIAGPVQTSPRRTGSCAGRFVGRAARGGTTAGQVH